MTVDIEQLQDWCRKGYYCHKGGADELEKEVGEYSIYEDVLEPIAYNICDRCGAVDWNEYLCWVDYLEEGYERDDSIVAGLKAEWAEYEARGEECVDYCALCDICENELVAKGKENGRADN